jgi:hypothetical protein
VRPPLNQKCAILTTLLFAGAKNTDSAQSITTSEMPETLLHDRSQAAIYEKLCTRSLFKTLGLMQIEAYPRNTKHISSSSQSDQLGTRATRSTNYNRQIEGKPHISTTKRQKGALHWKPWRHESASKPPCGFWMSDDK